MTTEKDLGFLAAPIGNIEKILSVDLTTLPVGKVDLRAAEQQKAYVCQGIRAVLQQASDAGLGHDEAVRRRMLSGITDRIRRLTDACEQLKKLSQGTSLHSEQFPRQCEQHITEISNQRESIDIDPLLERLEMIARLSLVERRSEATEEVRQAADAARRDANNIASSSKEAIQILDRLRKALVEITTLKAQSSYANRAKKLRWSEGIWLIVMVGGIGGIAYVLFKLMAERIDPNKVAEAVAILIRHLLQLSFYGIIARLALVRYNTERHLRLVYEHRDTVLQQYGEIDTALLDDKEARGQLRLALAKYLFTDPQTGLIDDRAAPDFNVSPIIAIAENATKAAKG